MNSVDYVRSVLKERKIAVSKMERDCGFSNGYISSLRKGTFPANRIKTISEYLDIPVSKLMNPDGDDIRYYSDETAEIAQEIFESKDLRLLFDVAHDAKPEDLKLAYDMLLALKRKEQGL